MPEKTWIDLGAVENLKVPAVREIKAGKQTIALSYIDGKFGAVSGVCNHAGGPLGKGTLEGAYLVCPWHQFRFHCQTGKGEPGYESDQVPQYELKEEGGHLYLNPSAVSKRTHSPHPPHPLTRPLQRQPGPIRVVGISTTAMNEQYPRYSTSEVLMDVALDHGKTVLGMETKRIVLNELKFRHCEGYYSKAAHACTWPCTITQMDESDELEQVYEAMVHWADIILLATPIRWGAASSLYFKMIERLNCIQNQITTHNRELIKNKVACFIVTGGQDNIQAVAGQMLGFFAELGFTFPPYPYIAHSRGWTAEDMERNIEVVAHSKALREGACALITRAKDTAAGLLSQSEAPEKIARGGRKAQTLEPHGG